MARVELRKLATEIRALRGARLLQQNRGARWGDQTQLKRLPVVQVRIHRDFHTGDLITFLVRALVYRNGNVEIASVGWSEGEMPIFWLENRGSAIH